MASGGLVMTNWHVMGSRPGALVYTKPADGAELTNARAFLARTLAVDAEADLALLQILEPPSSLRSTTLSDQAPVVAQDIHVIGHPNNNLWSYTTGVVSQIRPGYRWTYSDGSQHAADVLQVQTAISPGNSGGPVLDDQGRMLALIAFSLEGQNLNYAVSAQAMRLFLARARASRTRGTSTDSSSATPEYASAEFEGERSVVRLTFNNLSAYAVRNAAHELENLLIKAPEQTSYVAAWEPTSGGFAQWALIDADGTMLATAVGHRGSV